MAHCSSGSGHKVPVKVWLRDYKWRPQLIYNEHPIHTDTRFELHVIDVSLFLLLKTSWICKATSSESTDSALWPDKAKRKDSRLSHTKNFPSEKNHYVPSQPMKLHFFLPLLAFQLNCQKNKRKWWWIRCSASKPNEWRGLNENFDPDSELPLTMAQGEQETMLSMCEWRTATFSTFPILYRWKSSFTLILFFIFHFMNEHLTLIYAGRTKAGIEDLNQTQ